MDIQKATNFLTLTFLTLVLQACFQRKTEQELLDIALAHIDNKEYEKALGTYKKISNIDSVKIDGIYGQGISYSFMCDQNIDNCKNAISKFNEAINIDSTYKNLFYNRALCYFKLKQYTNAINDYNIAVNQEPTSADVIYGRALAYLFLTDSVSACNDLQSAIDLGFEYDIENFNNLCQKLAKKNPP
ncbi:MAG: tetratricopeptide repeat protein [Bacteroidota bacterium]